MDTETVTTHSESTTIDPTPLTSLSAPAGNRSDLINAVSQLVSSVSSAIKNDIGRIAIEDVLAQLETTDENFHSYDLVRSLRSQVEKAIGCLVDSKLESSVVDGDGHNVVAQITDDVLNSNEYSQMYQTFVSDLRTAVDEMMAGENLLFQPSTDQEAAYMSSSCSSATQYFNLDDSAASELLSSVHQTGLMFMSPEQLQSIANALHPSQPTQVRIDGMRHLLQFPCGDLVSCDNWPSLDAAIRQSLMDDDQQLANLCLKFYNRMYAAHMSTTTKFVYLGLAEELTTYFRSLEARQMILTIGLDASDDVCIKLLARFRLLNYIQQNLPSFWLRYNEKIVEAVIQSTFDLLSLSYSRQSLVGPVHFLALLDPIGMWFRKWMHGQYSRTFVLYTLKENPVLVQGVVSHVMSLKAVNLSKSSKQGSAKFRHSSESSSWLYSERVLDYVHFVHSLCLLERVLLYEGGRDLFPVHLQGNQASVTIVDLLVHLLNLLYSISESSKIVEVPNSSGPSWLFTPKLVIFHLFEEIASGNTQCRSILCVTELISVMIEPLKSALESSSPSASISNEVLVLMGDVLSVLASTENGRRYLLYGGNKDKKNESTKAPVHTIAKFVVNSLSLSASRQPLSSLSSKVTITWLFVCRHLYNTSDGLLILEPYQLHMHIARAWKKVYDVGEATMVNGRDDFSMEEALIDNLLNFAGTPKGLLLLSQSGLMSRCTHYMHQRYKLKLQVSKHEKFGYGCMVTQLASTAAGMSELNKCGFISMLVGELWTLLDDGGDDYRLTAPRDHPLDPMDRASHKTVINLLNVLSSYPALYEALQTPETPSPTVVLNSPSTVFDLLDMLVLVDSEVKKKSLLNYQEAHLFGLRIVSTIVTCLDSFLYLDSQYSLIDALFSMQRDCRMEDSSDIDSDFIVVDECSVERNRILVACYFIGGHNERVLPPHYLIKAEDDYPWPLFCSYPPPAVYHNVTSSVAMSSTTPTELFKHMQIPVSDSDRWLEQTRSLFQSLLKEHGTLPNQVMSSLLKKAVEVLSSTTKGTTFPPVKPDSRSLGGKKSTKVLLTSVDELGISLVLRYGQLLGLLQSSQKSAHTKDITVLLQQVKVLLESQQYTKVKDAPAKPYTGFDWFASSVFLLFEGRLDVSLEFLNQFSTLIQSGYTWFPRLYQCIHLPVDVAFSGINPITSITTHFVDLVLQREVPHVSSAVRMSGYTTSQICQHWLRQCFWNFLDWSEISLYLAVCILCGVDYQVYYCVSVLKHLESKILQHIQEQDLMVFLKEESLQGFHCSHWLEFMRQLEDKFRTSVLPAMTKIS